MLEIEYAQLSHSSKDRSPSAAFASSLPSTPEQRRTHGWLFSIVDEIEADRDAMARSAFALESISSGFRTASAYELHRALLPRLIQQTNAKLLQTRNKSASQNCLLASALRSDCAVISHVGDLRCYFIRRGHAELLTRDHTVSNDQRRLGSLPKKEPNSALRRQALARSLGRDAFVAVDVVERQIAAGDVLLACSYGFYSRVEETQMELIISDNRDLKIAVGELVSAAAKNDSDEKISVQLVRIDDVERVGARIAT